MSIGDSGAHENGASIHIASSSAGTRRFTWEIADGFGGWNLRVRRTKFFPTRAYDGACRNGEWRSYSPHVLRRLPAPFSANGAEIGRANPPLQVLPGIRREKALAAPQARSEDVGDALTAAWRDQRRVPLKSSPARPDRGLTEIPIHRGRETRSSLRLAEKPRQPLQSIQGWRKRDLKKQR